MALLLKASHASTGCFAGSGGAYTSASEVTHLPLRDPLTLEVLPDAAKPEEKTPVEKKPVVAPTSKPAPAAAK